MSRGWKFLILNFEFLITKHLCFVYGTILTGWHDGVV